MNKKYFFLILFLVPLCVHSQFVEKKIYNIKKTDKAPKIDGKLNESMWENIEIAKDFTQIEPNNGKPEREKQKTKVKIYSMAFLIRIIGLDLL